MFTLYYGICILFSFLIVDYIILHVYGDPVQLNFHMLFYKIDDNKTFSYIVVCKISLHTIHFLSKIKYTPGQ